jgi:hypothetical protein
VQSLGAGIDRDPLNSAERLFDPSHIGQMLSAGWGGVSYRLNTELSVPAWHCNPTGTRSDVANQQGYFVGTPTPSGGIERSFGYDLPHRGVTSNQGTSAGYSVLDDGDLNTYWKSDPCLAEHLTGESDSLHAQWVVVDLSSKKGVNAIKIACADPYAVNYQVQYWTGANAFNDPAHGNWQTFANGAVTTGSGGTATLQLSIKPLPVRFVRVSMSVSSGSCDTHGASDIRNCLGYAINEIYLGKLNRNRFVDFMQHQKSPNQTLTYCSSVDSWHSPVGIATWDGEQPGFDLAYTSGITRGLPMTVPVALLYDNPDNAANEISYLVACYAFRARRLRRQ